MATYFSIPIEDLRVHLKTPRRWLYQYRCMLFDWSVILTAFFFVIALVCSVFFISPLKNDGTLTTLTFIRLCFLLVMTFAFLAPLFLKKKQGYEAYRKYRLISYGFFFLTLDGDSYFLLWDFYRRNLNFDQNAFAALCLLYLIPIGFAIYLFYLAFKGKEYPIPVYVILCTICIFLFAFTSIADFLVLFENVSKYLPLIILTIILAFFKIITITSSTLFSVRTLH